MSSREDRPIGQAVIDSQEFAREGKALAGSVTVAELGRLADVLADVAGSLACELRGGRDGEGKLYLDLRVSGSLNLCCQRCLKPLPFALGIDSRLMLVMPGEPWPDEDLSDDELDAIEAGSEFDVLALVEDEILLALPIVPRHEVCRSPLAVDNEHRPSPFAALAKLKDH